MKNFAMRPVWRYDVYAVGRLNRIIPFGIICKPITHCEYDSNTDRHTAPFGPARRHHHRNGPSRCRYQQSGVLQLILVEKSEDLSHVLTKHFFQYECILGGLASPGRLDWHEALLLLPAHMHDHVATIYRDSYYASAFNCLRRYCALVSYPEKPEEIRTGIRDLVEPLQAVSPKKKRKTHSRPRRSFSCQPQSSCPNRIDQPKRAKPTASSPIQAHTAR